MREQAALKMMTLASLQRLIELYQIAGRSIQRKAASMTLANLQRFITLCNMEGHSI